LGVFRLVFCVSAEFLDFHMILNLFIFDDF
jgi:hypothetical protein